MNVKKFLYIAVGAPEGDPASASTEGGSTGNAGPAATSQTGDFVSRADYEKLQGDLRAQAGRFDKFQKDLAAERAATVDPPVSGEFDPAAFRRDLLRDTANVISLTQAAAQLRVDLPHADPSIFGRLDEFGSVEALTVAAEGSHQRVQAALDAQKEDLEKTLLSDFATRYGVKIEGAAGPQGTTEGGQPGGDPTPEQFARLSFAEQNALEAAHPGISDRILRAAK